ncbi:MAG: oxidoreductase [Robiginitomaculum sp.]|nr:MAG: oxidoreductase [Robiginitomaculum sp.]
MKITVIGGGPGGLYFALLTKKSRPDFDIEVYEQNRADDTFGFGVVFSDETLDEFLSADPASYDMIRDHFAHWSDIVIDHKGMRTIVGGNGFAGCSRLTLLQVLQDRCEAVGVSIHYSTIIDPDTLGTRFADSDLIIAADGINSAIRNKHRGEFGMRTQLRPNHFVWLGSSRPLDAFTFFFKETEHGHFCAHTYQYEEGHSTWVVETTDACWQASGFADMNEDECAKYLEGVFTEALDGHGFMTNRSLWRNFPVITCDRWHAGNIVLLGDNKATAHWSIGSGTKLAMECAIGLSEAVLDNAGHLPAIFEQYEKTRRTPVEITQHNAAVSLRWFENMAQHWDKSRYAFAFSLMSRAKSITWDNLKLRDADFLRAAEDEYYQRYQKKSGLDVSTQRPTPMFTPVSLRGLTIPNRVAVAPMAQYSAVDGTPMDWHFSHYTARALGGAGLIFVEMTCPSADARITDGCTGLWSDEHEAAWARINDFVHQNTGAKMALQLGHAGRKGSTQRGWETPDHPKSQDNWPLFSASALPYLEGISARPSALTRGDMYRIRDEFVAATKRADRAGFDMLELHCAHGYLLASFLSPLTNTRNDDYGGSAQACVKFPLEVFAAMRAVWPDGKPMSVRLSSSDWAEGGLDLEDLKIIARSFKDAGVDIIHASSGQTVPWQKPVYGRMWQTPFAEYIRQEVGIPTIAVGDITLPEQINTIIADGRADLCALARPHLNNPNFTRQAAGHYGVRDQNWPPQYETGEYQLYREAEKTNEKALELALKARPNRRHYTRAVK